MENKEEAMLIMEDEAQTKSREGVAAMDEVISVELPAPPAWKKLVSLSLFKSFKFSLNLGPFLPERSFYPLDIAVFVSVLVNFISNVLFLC